MQISWKRVALYGLTLAAGVALALTGHADLGAVLITAAVSGAVLPSVGKRQPKDPSDLGGGVTFLVLLLLLAVGCGGSVQARTAATATGAACEAAFRGCVAIEDEDEADACLDCTAGVCAGIFTRLEEDE